MLRHRTRCSALCFIAVISITDAYAGAWTQEKGRGQFVLNQTFYYANAYYDNNGKLRPKLLYRKYDLNPYVEYGLLDSVTVGGSLSLQYVQQELFGGRMYSYGLGDSEFFTRLRLVRHGDFVFSAEPLVKLPSPQSSDRFPRLGSAYPDAALGAYAGYGFGSRYRPHFADLYLGYRWRFGEPHDQIRATATLGYSFSQRWMVMPQIFIIKRREAPPLSRFTQSAGDDYTLGKTQLSVVYKMNTGMSAQAGLFIHDAGTNTGAGGGMVVSLWRNF